MSLDQEMFFMVGSDIDEEELMSLISQKRAKKLCRKQVINKGNIKNSSMSSSPASSPPDSDDNASSCSTISVSSAAFSPLQAEQNKRKKRDTDDDTNGNKKLRTDSGIRSVCHSNSQPVFVSCLPKVSEANTKRPVPVPNSWRSVNSSHYIFSSDEELDETESRSSDRDFSPKDFTPQNRGKNSQLWNKSNGKNQKGNGSPKTQGSWKTSTDCLTSCRSCQEYSMPSVSDQEISEMSGYLALDCEFVGVGPNNTSSLGRCSIVDHQGKIVFDRFVKPPEEVTDYRTRWSGLRPRDIRCGIPFAVAQEMIAAIIKDKVVVGHAVFNDFRVMDLDHPVHLIRDTASCKMLCDMADLPAGTCALRKLTSALLGRTIQQNEHCSVTDARACLDLFRLVRTQWEPVLQAKFERRAARKSAKKVKVTGKVHNTETDPELHSFFDDQYWPEDLFKDSSC